MELNAAKNAEVTYLRAQMPEFEPRFKALEEDGWEPSSFEAMSEYARWLAEQTDEELLRRGFEAIERIYVDQAFLMGGELAVEFFEALRDIFAPRSRFERWLDRRLDRKSIEEPKELRGFFGSKTAEWFEHFG